MTHPTSNLKSLIERISARIPSSVTPVTRIELHPSEWLQMIDIFSNDSFQEAYDHGFAIGSGDEGAYQREIARLRAALGDARTYLVNRPEIPPSLFGRIDSALSSDSSVPETASPKIRDSEGRAVNAKGVAFADVLAAARRGEELDPIDVLGAQSWRIDNQSREIASLRKQLARVRSSDETTDQEVYAATGHFPQCGVGEGTHEGPCDCSGRAEETPEKSAGLKMAQAILEAEDLLTCARPAEHLEGATPEEWYKQRATWYARNTFQQSAQETSADQARNSAANVALTCDGACRYDGPGLFYRDPNCSTHGSRENGKGD